MPRSMLRRSKRCYSTIHYYSAPLLFAMGEQQRSGIALRYGRDGSDLGLRAEDKRGNGSMDNKDKKRKRKFLSLASVLPFARFSISPFLLRLILNTCWFPAGCYANAFG